MTRQETIKVWNPDPDDDIFTINIQGVQHDAITNEDGDYVGQQPSGDIITYEFNFPTADKTSEEVLETLLDTPHFTVGSSVIENSYVVYDSENHSAFDTGCEGDQAIAIHPKQNTDRETLLYIYKQIQNQVDQVQVRRFYHKF